MGLSLDESMKDVVKLPQLGILNWISSLYCCYVRGYKNRESVYIYRALHGEYKRFVVKKPIRMLLELFRRGEFDTIIGGGWSIPGDIDFDRCARLYDLYMRYPFPIAIDADSKHILGVIKEDSTLNQYESQIDILIEHSDIWSMNNVVSIDISEINSANYKLFKLAKMWSLLKIENYNKSWTYLGVNIECAGVNDAQGDNDLIEEDTNTNLKSISDIVEHNEYKETVCALEYLSSQGVDCYVFTIPEYDDLPHTRDEEIRHNENITGFSQPDDEEIGKQLEKVYGECYSLKESGKIGIYLKQIYRNGITRLADYHSDDINITDGRRHTVGNGERDRRIHIYGPCTIGGAYVPDYLTIPSLIQNRINDDGYELDVTNYGTVGFYRSYVNKMKRSAIRRGDIVVVVDLQQVFKPSYFYPEKVKVISLRDAYIYGPRDMYFEVPAHMSGSGNRVLADYIYTRIREGLDSQDKSYTNELVRMEELGDNTATVTQEIYEWAEQWDQFKDVKGGSRGAIVMNCNPFTLGHKYLIDFARERVDYLYIFVVEEDRSFFSFSDRFDMVKKASDGYRNVCVVPSGKWVLSNATMPEYFTKESNQDQIVCGADDLEMFANEIAPVFSISVRFVGEESTDIITRQYNESMKRLLPQYGISLVEIPRRRIGDAEISASNVRKYIKTRQYDKIKELVPEYTYMVIWNSYRRKRTHR